MKAKKAYISIEATFAITALLVFFSLLIGLFGYVVPRMYLEKEVQTLAQMVKINGGVTTTQYDELISILGKYGTDVEVLIYNPETPSVQLTSIAPKGTSYALCTDTTKYVPFSKRSDGLKIIIKVKMKVASQQLMSILGTVGITAFGSDYSVYEVVLSERNQC